MIHENAKEFFEKHFGQQSSEFVTLAQSGSSRVNFKASNSTGKYIITYNENLRENDSFLYFSQLFTKLQLNTPQILAVSEDKKLYIQEFLGEKTLSEVIADDCDDNRIKKLVQETLLKLYQIQQKTNNQIDYSKTFEYEAYDELPIMHDLYYFKNFIADVLDLEYHKSSLLKEFKNIINVVENLEPKGLMIRDFQARNIMVGENDSVSFIDYQGAMRGPLMYDVISFLFQAKANFPAEFKNEMLDFYINLFDNENIKLKLKNSVKPLQLMRFLQVLGAYGLRGLVQHKPHFIASIEKGIQNLSDFNENWDEMKKYPELQNIITQLRSPQVKLKIEKFSSF